MEWENCVNSGPNLAPLQGTHGMQGISRPSTSYQVDFGQATASRPDNPTISSNSSILRAWFVAYRISWQPTALHGRTSSRMSALTQGPQRMPRRARSAASERTRCIAASTWLHGLTCYAVWIAYMASFDSTLGYPGEGPQEGTYPPLTLIVDGDTVDTADFFWDTTRKRASTLRARKRLKTQGLGANAMSFLTFPRFRKMAQFAREASQML
jgi:hypothetical protein